MVKYTNEDIKTAAKQSIEASERQETVILAETGEI